MAKSKHSLEKRRMQINQHFAWFITWLQVNKIEEQSANIIKVEKIREKIKKK